MPPDGELTPDIVRAALGLPGAAAASTLAGLSLPEPAAAALRRLPARATRSTRSSRRSPASATPSSPPTSAATRSARCRPTTPSSRASAWARRSAWPRARPTPACSRPSRVIGDSTFLHSGVTPLMDAVAANTDMTLIILDNETTAMTGGQPTILPSSRLAAARARPRRRPGALPRGRRAPPAHRRRTREIIRSEIEHPGLSVDHRRARVHRDAAKTKAQGAGKATADAPSRA